MAERAAALCHYAQQAVQLRANAYQFHAHDRSGEYVVVGHLTYDNPWIAIDSAVQCGEEWYLCLERTRGTVSLGGFRRGCHYTFRELDALEIPRRTALFAAWVNAVTRFLMSLCDSVIIMEK